ncbi:MAG: hypothetical protein KBI07_06745 [Candidatus Atribacteria bacterium]|nr:hypothetical protein [Candidatus Atribacteria bacterium]
MTKKGHKDLCMDVYFRDDYIEINPYTGDEMGVINPYTGEIIPLRKMRRRKHSNPYEYETQGFEPYE